MMEHASWAWFILKLLLYSYFILFALRKCLQFFLRFYHPSLKVGWISVSDLSWQRPHCSVNLKRLALTMGYDSRSSQSRWFWAGVRAEGIDVLISPVLFQKDEIPPHSPSKGRLRQPPLTTSPSVTEIQATPLKSSKLIQFLRFAMWVPFYIITSAIYITFYLVVKGFVRKPQATCCRALRFLRHKFAIPTLHALNYLGRQMERLLNLLDYELRTVNVVLADVGSFAFTARAGLGVFRGSTEGSVKVWLKLGALEINSAASPETVAIALYGALYQEFSIPLDPQMGLAGAYARGYNKRIELLNKCLVASTNYIATGDAPQQLEGLVINYQILNQLLDKCGKLVKSPSAASNTHSHSIPPAPSANTLNVPSNFENIPSNFARREALLSYLDAIDFILPPVHLIHSVSGGKAKMVFSVGSLRARLRFQDTVTQEEIARHFGRGEAVYLQGDVRIPSLKAQWFGSCMDKGQDLLVMDHINLALATSWMPPKAERSFSLGVHRGIALKKNHFRAPPLLCAVLELGEIHGEVGLDDIYKISSAIESLTPVRKASSPSPITTPVNAALLCPPQIEAVFVAHGLHYAVHGPEGVQKWPQSDSLVIAFANLHAHCSAELADISIGITPQHRRELRQNLSAASSYPYTDHRSSSRQSNNDSGIELLDESSFSLSSEIPFLMMKNRGPVSNYLHSILDDGSSLDHTIFYAANVHYEAAPIEVYLVASSKSGNRTRFDCLEIGPITGRVRMEAMGTEIPVPTENLVQRFLAKSTLRIEMDMGIHKIHVDLWQAEVLQCLKLCFASLSESNTAARSPKTRHNGVLQSLPASLILRIAIANLKIKIGGLDPEHKSSTVRGLEVVSKSIKIDAACQQTVYRNIIPSSSRQSLGLPVDIRGEINAQCYENPDHKLGVLQITVNDTKILPLSDRSQTISVKPRFREPSGKQEKDKPSQPWEFTNRAALAEDVRKTRYRSSATKKQAKPFSLPFIECRATVQHKLPDSHKEVDEYQENIGIGIRSKVLDMAIEIYHIYCMLMAINVIKTVFPSKSRTANQEPSTSRSQPVNVTLQMSLRQANIFINLPDKIPLFLLVKQMELRKSPASDVDLGSETVLLAVVSKHVSEASGKVWEELLLLNGAKLRIGENQTDTKWNNTYLDLNAKSLRVRVPYLYPVADIIDNTANMVKVVKQLCEQFLHGQPARVIQPHPESVKKLPRIHANIENVCLEFEDDPFETKLGALIRAGKDEQLRRLRQWKAYEDKSQLVEKERQRQADLPQNVVEGALIAFNPVTNFAITSDQAEYLLKERQCKNWTNRIRAARRDQEKREDTFHRDHFGKTNGPSFANPSEEEVIPIVLANHSISSPLFRLTLPGFAARLTKPTFSANPNGLHEFMDSCTPGLPSNLEYSLLVAFNIQLSVRELIARIRDYPVPLLHTPPATKEEGTKRWSMYVATDFVIAEQMGPAESVRHAEVEITPGRTSGVTRTAMPVMSYCQAVITIDSKYATRFGWGVSMQPAIQDIIRVLESLTRAPADPSERLGFWDKFRLILHWLVSVKVIGTGGFHILMKGSRNPYELQEFGSGFALCWKNNVLMTIGIDNPENEFLQIAAADFIMGVPDLSEYEDANATGSQSRNWKNDLENSLLDGNHIGERYKKDPTFRKIIAEFGGGVCWGMGMKLERSCRDADHPHAKDDHHCLGRKPFHRKCRMWEFEPYWKVITTNADGRRDANGNLIDSFGNFRSDFIHFWINVEAGFHRGRSFSDTSSQTNQSPLQRVNEISLSPESFTHFWAWLALFGGPLSLPIRNGKQFSHNQPPSKKFGKHCATIKYGLNLGTVSIAHPYVQHSYEDWAAGRTTEVGLKLRAEDFKLDLHQRAQEELITHPTKGTRIVVHKIFGESQISATNLDLRAIYARFQEPVKKHHFETNRMSYPDGLDDSAFSELCRDVEPLSENDPWFNLNDFCDLGYQPPAHGEYHVKLVEVLTCPQITYTRQAPESIDIPYDFTEIDCSKAQKLTPYTKFGHEHTHVCSLGHAPTASEVEIGLVRRREADLKEAAKKSSRAAHAVKILSDFGNKYEEYAAGIPQRSGSSTSFGTMNARAQKESNGSTSNPNSTHDKDAYPPFATGLADSTTSYSSVLTLCSPKTLVSMACRQLLELYVRSHSNRKGDMYTLSHTFISLVKAMARTASEENTLNTSQKYRQEQRSKSSGKSQNAQKSRTPSTLTEEAKSGITQLAQEIRAEGTYDSSTSLVLAKSDEDFADHSAVSADLQPNWTLQASTLINITRPQVAFKARLDEGEAFTVAINQVELKVYQVTDDNFPVSDINHVVMHRSIGILSGLQAFYPSKLNITKNPQTFVPIEVAIDLKHNYPEFVRVISQTSAAVHYDKRNALRLSKKEDSMSGTTDVMVDRVTLRLPEFRLKADPTVFSSLFNSVLSIILFRDPARRRHSKNLQDKIFANDKPNYTEIAGHLEEQQAELRDILDQIDRVHEATPYLLMSAEDLEEFADLIFTAMTIRENLAVSLDAIRTVTKWDGTKDKSKKVNVDKQVKSTLLNAIAAKIEWVMTDENQKPFARFAMSDLRYRWKSDSDGAAQNRLVIGDLVVTNPSPDCIFSSVVTKLKKSGTENEISKLELAAALFWDSQAPIGGVSLVERFEVHLHPMKIAVEREHGDAIKGYIFSSNTKLAGRSALDSVSETSSVYSNSTENLHSNMSPFSSQADLHSTSPRKSQESSRSKLLSPYDARRGPRSLKKRSSNTHLALAASRDQAQIEIMRQRSSMYRSFEVITIASTTLEVSYKGPKKKTDRIPDVYNLLYRSPAIVHENQIWSYKEFADQVQKDLISSILHQTLPMVSQFIRGARKMPSEMKNELRSRLHVPAPPKALSKLRHPRRSRSPSTPEARESTSDDYYTHEADTVLESDNENEPIYSPPMVTLEGVPLARTMSPDTMQERSDDSDSSGSGGSSDDYLMLKEK